MEYNKELVDDTLDRLKLRRDKYNKQWVDKFNSLTRSSKKRVIKYMERAQADFITDKMSNLQKDIKLHRLGKFYAKDARIRYYELKDKYPDKPIKEIVEQVVAEYIERKKKEKEERNKNKL